MELSEKMDLLNRSEEFRYQLLDRMRTDCNYYLGYGNRNPGELWAQNEAEHIEIMRLLYDSFPDDKKPEWLSKTDIDEYENKMAMQEPASIRRSRGR